MWQAIYPGEYKEAMRKKRGIIMKKIMVEGIEVKMTRKKIKNINISVRAPDGEVRLSAPLGAKEEEIKRFVLSKIEWIKKHQQEFKNQPAVVEYHYKSGESHYFMGEKYILNIVEIEKTPGTIEIRDGTYIDLSVKKKASKEQKEKKIKEWHRKELKLRIPPLIEKWEKIMGVKVWEFRVKQMKTRWGTCNITARRIWINLELAKKPPHCLEYIVVHEMVHLLEPSHNQRFKAYMDQFLPNWQALKAELNA